MAENGLRKRIIFQHFRACRCARVTSIQIRKEAQEITGCRQGLKRQQFLHRGLPLRRNAADWQSPWWAVHGLGAFKCGE